MKKDEISPRPLECKLGKIARDRFDLVPQLFFDPIKPLNN
jgi:hypothetical protein